jgi:PAS domain S-box-containing protein
MGAGRDRSGADQRPEELGALRAENDALRARIASLVAVIEVVDDAVFVKGGDGRYRMINSAGARLLGRSRDEVVGKDDTELFEAETAERLMMDDRSIIAEGAARTYEEVATSSGVTRTYLVTKGPYRDDRGLVAGLVGISRDITAWRRDDAELREAREFLARLLDHVPASIYVTSADGEARLVNRAWEGLFEMRRDDVVGRSAGRLFPPEEAGRFLEQNRTVIESGTPLELDEAVSTPGGQRELHTVKFPLRDATGRIEAVGGISFDVTDRRSAEESLEESRRRMRALFENTLDAIWLLDDEGRFVDANPAVCALLGYTREEFLRMRIEDVATADEKGLVKELWNTILTAGQLDGEFTQVRRDGTTRVVDYRAVANILPGLHLSVNRDITERKRAERELRASDEQVRLLLDSTGEAICGIDLEGRCTFFNASCLRILGYADRADLLGRDLHRLIHHTRPGGEPLPREACRILCACRCGEEAHAEDEVFWRGDGTSFPVEYWSHPVRHGGAVVGAVVTFVDISERRRVEEELRETAARLQVLSRRLVEVQEEERRHLARELHDEIGQVLTVIGISLQAAKKARVDAAALNLDDCIGLVDGAIRQVRHLSLDLRPSMLDDLGLVATLRWYVDRQAQRAGYRARFISDAVEIRLDPAIATAAFRVAQEALTNIARHAKARRVSVSVRRSDGSLRLLVRDDGAGFDSGEALRYGARGSGLGLLGMRERAALLGGRVEVRSRPGRGTRVLLTIPLRHPEGGV